MGRVVDAVTCTVVVSPGLLRITGVKVAAWNVPWGKLKSKNLRASVMLAAVMDDVVIARRPASAAASQACCMRARAI